MNNEEYDIIDEEFDDEMIDEYVQETEHLVMRNKIRSERRRRTRNKVKGRTREFQTIFGVNPEKNGKLRNHQVDLGCYKWPSRFDESASSYRRLLPAREQLAQLNKYGEVE